MIHPSHGVQIFVATKPVDFRKDHDGLAALVQSHLQKKPYDGAVHVFRAKRADRLKLIYWDGTGQVWSWPTSDLSKTHSNGLPFGMVFCRFILRSLRRFLRDSTGGG